VFSRVSGSEIIRSCINFRAGFEGGGWRCQNHGPAKIVAGDKLFGIGRVRGFGEEGWPEEFTVAGSGGVDFDEVLGEGEVGLGNGGGGQN